MESQLPREPATWTTPSDGLLDDGEPYTDEELGLIEPAWLGAEYDARKADHDDDPASWHLNYCHHETRSKVGIRREELPCEFCEYNSEFIEGLIADAIRPAERRAGWDPCP